MVVSVSLSSVTRLDVAVDVNVLCAVLQIARKCCGWRSKEEKALLEELEKDLQEILAGTAVQGRLADSERGESHGSLRLPSIPSRSVLLRQESRVALSRLIQQAEGEGGESSAKAATGGAPVQSPPKNPFMRGTSEHHLFALAKGWNSERSGSRSSLQAVEGALAARGVRTTNDTSLVDAFERLCVEESRHQRQQQQGSPIPLGVDEDSSVDGEEEDPAWRGGVVSRGSGTNSLAEETASLSARSGVSTASPRSPMEEWLHRRVAGGGVSMSAPSSSRGRSSMRAAALGDVEAASQSERAPFHPSSSTPGIPTEQLRLARNR